MTDKGLERGHGEEDGERVGLVTQRERDEDASRSEAVKQLRGTRFEAFFERFYALRYVSVALWVVAVGACVPFALGFPAQCENVFTPPADSPAGIARAEYARRFPNLATEQSTVLFLETLAPCNSSGSNKTECPDVFTGGWGAAATRNLTRLVRSFANASYVRDVVGRFTFDPAQYAGDELAERFLQRAFVSADNRSTLVLVATADAHAQRAFVDHVRGGLAAGAVDTRNGTYAVLALGPGTLAVDVSRGTARDLRSMDGVAVPVALLVVALVVRSLALLVLPLASVACSVATAFAAMHGVARTALRIADFTPAVMMTLALALSVDYALFLLTRLTEERRRGVSYRAALMCAHRFSGATILTSGTVLSVCLLSLVALPVHQLRGIGLGATLAVACTVAVNVWLLPALLAACPRLFALQGVAPCVRACRHPPRLTPHAEQEADNRSWWFRFATWATASVPHALAVVAAVCALAAPCCCGLRHMRVVIDYDHSIPRGSPTSLGMKRFAQQWPIGQLFSYTIFAVPKGSGGSSSSNSSSGSSSSYEGEATIMSDEFFGVSHDLVNTVGAMSGFNKSHIVSIASVGGVELELGFAQMLLDEGELAYTYLFNTLVDSNATPRAARMTVATDGDPNHNVSFVPLALRPVLANLTRTTRYDFHLTGRMAEIYDAVAAILRAYPLTVAATVATIAVLVAAAFRSAVLPLRMVLSIALTLLWTYGTASLIFCTGVLARAVPAIAADPGLSWAAPILSVSILVGLAMDYDIFLFVRVREFRAAGWSNRAAVVKGVTKTGSVITYAGIVMAIAFSGLLLSGLMIMNQFGVILVLAVLFDTFVVRTTLTPALLYLFGEANYWPVRYSSRRIDSATPAHATGSIQVVSSS